MTGEFDLFFDWIVFRFRWRRRVAMACRMTIDLSALTAAYLALRPDPAVAAQRVAFGTSGHRGSALDTAFNEDHILAITQAVCDWRSGHGVDGPLFLGRDTHALSEPAWMTAREVLAGNGVDVRIDARAASPRRR